LLFKQEGQLICTYFVNESTTKEKVQSTMNKLGNQLNTEKVQNKDFLLGKVEYEINIMELDDYDARNVEFQIY